ncbi:hypothetical protein PGB90_000391 [Kerria lacca]
MDDNRSLRAPILDSHPYHGFKPLETIWIVLFMVFLVVTVQIICFACIFGWIKPPVKCDLFYSLVYAEVSVWVIYFIIRFYINWKHRICLMAKGYFEFYETCSRYIELPFYVSCVWLSIIVVLLCWYTESETPPESYCDTSHIYSPIITVAIGITLCNSLEIALFVIYIKKVFEFNSLQNPPDSENGSQWMPNMLQETLSSGDMGYRERCEVIDNMVEKQADLIRYYRESNEVLKKKLFDLTSHCRSVLESNDVTMAIFADDTAVKGENKDLNEASSLLQNQLSEI